MAFGVSEIGVVGAKNHVIRQQEIGDCDVRIFGTLEEARQYFHGRNAEICGIEIGENSCSIFKTAAKEVDVAGSIGDENHFGISTVPSDGNTHVTFADPASDSGITVSGDPTAVGALETSCLRHQKHPAARQQRRTVSLLTGESPFSKDRNCCFMPGNESSGMSEKQMRICDFFVYIPQHSKKTASLNVLVATSIIMHHFALFADFHETMTESKKLELEASHKRLEKDENSNEEGERTDSERGTSTIMKMEVEEKSGDGHVVI